MTARAAPAPSRTGTEAAPADGAVVRSQQGEPVAKAERVAVVAEARTWLGTPFHHMGQVKGKNGGVDCAFLALMVYRAALPHRVPAFEPGYYAPTWNMSRAGAAGEPYLASVLATPGVAELGENENPLPGDLALFHWGLAWAHGAIVVAWPLVIHADMEAGQVIEAHAAYGRLGRRRRRFFSFW